MKLTVPVSDRGPAVSSSKNIHLGAINCQLQALKGEDTKKTRTVARFRELMYYRPENIFIAPQTTDYAGQAQCTAIGTDGPATTLVQKLTIVEGKKWDFDYH